MVDEYLICEVSKDGRVLVYNNTDQEFFSNEMTSGGRWPRSQNPPHFFLVKLSTDVF